MSKTYRSIVLAKRPKDNIVPGETFKSQTQPVPKESDLKDGQVILQVLYVSIDPAMRGWLNDARSYLPPVKIGGVMRSFVLGKVIASKSKSFPTGSYAEGALGWAELIIAREKELTKVEIPKNGRLTDRMGVLGPTGLTAYFGLLDIGKVKSGDVVVVSGAAGAVGSVVGQIAKLKGAKVIGIAGSDDKVQWLRDLGFDDALNYKDRNFEKNFRNATKSLIDVYFDNVGGDILDLALSRAKPFARFVMCGGISQYNTAVPKGPKNYLMIVAMRIRMEGFVVFDYEPRYDEARRELAKWLAEGKIQRKETIVQGGLLAAEQALADLYNGINTGKLLVEVKPDDGADTVRSSL